MMKHVWDCPNEWIQLDEAGHLNLPEHYAGDPDPDSPAYFINARFLCYEETFSDQKDSVNFEMHIIKNHEERHVCITWMLEMTKWIPKSSVGKFWKAFWNSNVIARQK